MYKSPSELARNAAITMIVFMAASAFAIPAPSMYADRIARDVGDIVTIQIVENTTASAVAGTNTKSEYGASLSAGGTGALDFIPLLSGEGASKSEHKGDGRTTRQGRLYGTVTARVVEVLPNGYLRIEGQKSVVINGERQLTILSGVVRTDDITPDNSIRSDLIADAEITFKGKGALANSERPGIIARVFDWLF
ncbi:flagellar basal body L-ring protein FlgH [candidate division KSB1 bacterium]|nr:flagellar basal body L-ring protein FlgH [candidate division KSB1 bacterium]